MKRKIDTPRFNFIFQNIEFSSVTAQPKNQETLQCNTPIWKILILILVDTHVFTLFYVGHNNNIIIFTSAIGFFNQWLSDSLKMISKCKIWPLTFEILI